VAWRAQLPRDMTTHPRFAVALGAAALFVLALLAGCRRGGEPASATAALGRFFETARRHDYAATYDCYDAAYQAKVTRDEFVRHRAEASPLDSWRLLSLEEHGDRAHAIVALVFGPSARAGRATQVSKTVEEELVREPGGWRIKVW
jgi:hypothetical protein